MQENFINPANLDQPRHDRHPERRLDWQHRGFAWQKLLAAFAIVTCLTVATGFWVISEHHPRRHSASDADEAGSKPATIGGVPLYKTWPKQAPDLALVITGQTYGYLSPCGCSRPQKGGLERRANLMNSLRDKGWTVVGLDLGDAAPAKGLAKQNLLKYRFLMQALAAMGYAAIGLGEYEFHTPLFNLLAEYTLQFSNQRPIILAANLLGVQRDSQGQPQQIFPRDVYFSAGPNNRPMIEAFEVITTPEKPSIGVVGVIGKDAASKVEKLDPQFGFADNSSVIKNALQALAQHPAKPEIRVLLYSGSLAQAKAAAEAFPQFQIVVCQSEEAEPPQFPTVVNNGQTMIVQVGQKGQNVGVVGIFKSANSFDLKYQLVPVGEEYLTPTDPDPMKNAAIEKNHKVLALLEQYAVEVKKNDLLALARSKPLLHPAQIQQPQANLTYVGADTCGKCHAAEYAVWKASKHSHAYEALEKYATRPRLRQYDPECVICHTTGFEYVSGFENETVSPHLKHNGCENCHGPGSAHAKQPFNKDFYAALMPWKANAGPEAKLPSLEFMKEMAAKKPLERGSVAMNPTQKLLVSAVTAMCMKCHDGENDPKFEFYEYFPKIYHSGLKNAGLPPGAK
jgi:2',3'-cyclic-nucleotide 2'-phosphodiesterase (5'-nucleotidase family)